MNYMVCKLYFLESSYIQGYVCVCICVYKANNDTVIKEIDSVLRYLSTHTKTITTKQNKTPSLVISTKQEEITTNLPKFIQESEEKGLVPNSFCEAFHLDVKTKDIIKENYRPLSLMKPDAKF